MGQWHVVVDFSPVVEADAAWKLWRASNDISGLADTDIRIDTGRGAHERTERRYSIRRSAMEKIQGAAAGVRR